MYKKKFDVEVQQRACEYSELIQIDPQQRKQIVQRLPVLEIALEEQQHKGTGTKAETLVQKTQQPNVQKEITSVTVL